MSNEFTPTQMANSIAIEWLRRAHADQTSDIKDLEPPNYQHKVRRQVAKLHNQLLVQSNLDGLALEDD